MTSLESITEKSAIYRDTGDTQGNRKGLGVVRSSVLLVGELAGTGVIALPYLMDGTGYMGVVCIFVQCLVCAYTGHILGRCWVIVQDRYDEFKGHVRHPYPTIAFITFGPTGRTLLSFCSNFTMFCSSVVILIVSSQNISSLLQHICGVHLPFCYLIIILAVLMLPLTWLGTPKDFWLLGVVATGSTLIAVVILIIAVAMDAAERHPDDGAVGHSQPDVFSLFTALGAMMFMTGGHYAFLVVQNDMERPRDFRWTIVLTYTTLSILYVPLGILGYVFYGDRATPNILLTLTPGPLTYLATFLVTIHTLCALIININPMLQHSEEAARLDHGRGWRHILLRSGIFLAMLLVTLTLPSFGIILSLAGATTNTLIACVFPAACYFQLSRMEGDWPKLEISLHIRVLLLEIVGVALVIGVMATIGNILVVVEGVKFDRPCYLDMSLVGGH